MRFRPESFAGTPDSNRSEDVPGKVLMWLETTAASPFRAPFFLSGNVVIEILSPLPSPSPRGHHRPLRIFFFKSPIPVQFAELISSRSPESFIFSRVPPFFLFCNQEWKRAAALDQPGRGSEHSRVKLLSSYLPVLAVYGGGQNMFSPDSAKKNRPRPTIDTHPCAEVHFALIPNLASVCFTPTPPEDRLTSVVFSKSARESKIFNLSKVL